MNDGMTVPAGATELLLTAEEAFPAFETAVIEARDRIVLGFRVFDPMTRLRTEAGLAIGRDWFDLLQAKLQQGVAVDLLLCDFDPIVSHPLHRLTWSSLRKMWAVAEMAGPGAPLTIRDGQHPCQIGLLPRLLLWPKVLGELRDIRKLLNAMPEDERRACLRDMPRLAEHLQMDEAGQVRGRLTGPPRLYPVSHHQKIAVIDGEVLYIGGLDLNPRRYDTKTHRRPAEETWHDVQIITRGPVAAVAERYLRAVPEVVAGRASPPTEALGLRSTLSSRRRDKLFFLSPARVRRSINATLFQEVSRARRFVYLETQFFRDRPLARALARAGRANPDLQLLMVLPAAPEDVAFEGRKKLDARFGEFLQARCVRKVRKAFGRRALFVSPAQPRTAGAGQAERRDRHFDAPLIYVHAKLSVFDGRSLMVSSANLNGRSLHWDTEAGLFLEEPDFARTSLERALAHWLPNDPDLGGADLSQIVPLVRRRAIADGRRAPEDRTGFLLPYSLRPAEEFGQDLPGIPDELV